VLQKQANLSLLRLQHQQNSTKRRAHCRNCPGTVRKSQSNSDVDNARRITEHRGSRKVPTRTTFGSASSCPDRMHAACLFFNSAPLQSRYSSNTYVQHCLEVGTVSNYSMVWTGNQSKNICRADSIEGNTECTGVV
jgi:hypothetical protein